jgi:8-oxo-dGTP pyrophosphatase MutT (NUDIX family)
MLLYYPVSARDPDPPVLAEQGVSAPDDGVRLWTTLEAVPEDAGPVLVVDARTLSNRPAADGASVQVPSVPPAAFRNTDPYRAPAPVVAGGGYVGCPLPDDVALLLIYRRGVWDLPKGTRDSGESVEGCARREVQEEVGIEALRLVHPLGTTQHGYVDGDRYAVKTTHWYLMRTPERAFEPDRREGIRRVARGRWAVARAHMGYDTLRRHMDRVEETVRAALQS